MQRRRYLVAYDIRNPRRLRAVAQLMLASGNRIQYSVFLADLDRKELSGLQAALEALIDRSADTVAFVNLGAATGGQPSNVAWLGQIPTISWVPPVVV
jgi:CRISPR-associated protein Cas2